MRRGMVNKKQTRLFQYNHGPVSVHGMKTYSYSPNIYLVRHPKMEIP